MIKVNQVLIMFLIVVITLLTQANLAAQDELLTEAPEQYRIYGKVTDSHGSPVADATVSLMVNAYYDLNPDYSRGVGVEPVQRVVSWKRIPA